MNRLAVWHHVLTNGSSSAAVLSPVVRAILDGIARHGIGTAPVEPTTARGPGIVFFDDATPAVVERIRQLARGGMDRVIAVATSVQAASAGGCWPLLDHAAADVLACAPERDVRPRSSRRPASWNTNSSVARFSRSYARRT